MVRYRVGVGAAQGGEREGISTVIASLSELPIAQLFDADDFLARIGGTDSPQLDVGDSQEQRRAYQDAWKAWWAPRSTTFDLVALQAPNRQGVALAAVISGDGGSVLELKCDQNAPIRVLRRIDNLVYPVAVEPLPRDRVLVCEYRGHKVTERDFTGKVHWEFAINFPLAVQRIPGGGCLIAGRREIVCVNRDKTVRFRFNKENISGAVRRPDKSIVIVTNVGICETVDENGATLSSFSIGRGLQILSVQMLPGGRLLIPDYSDNRVVEYNAAGQQVWEAEFARPNAAVRFPNGKTLVSSRINSRIAELDAEGHVLREFRPGDNWHPWGLTLYK